MNINDLLLVALARRAAKDGTAKEVRIANGLTQADVGSVCGVTPQAVTRWERGVRVPGSEAALRYGRLLRRLGVEKQRGAAA